MTDTPVNLAEVVAPKRTRTRKPYKLACPPKDVFIDLPAIDWQVQGREDTQGVWVDFFAAFINNCTVLDVGAGLCGSRNRYQAANRGIRPFTQEPHPDSPADFTGELKDIPAAMFDYVSAFDVLEHVRQYDDFLKHLRRIAKKGVAITTPNYCVTKNHHEFHVREFTPEDLVNVMEDYVGPYDTGWVMDPKLGIIRVTREEFVANKDCYNMMLFCRV
jgi:hypothetical protein